MVSFQGSWASQTQEYRLLSTASELFAAWYSPTVLMFKCTRSGSVPSSGGVTQTLDTKLVDEGAISYCLAFLRGSASIAVKNRNI
jgi:hypothetical protein